MPPYWHHAKVGQRNFSDRPDVAFFSGTPGTHALVPELPRQLPQLLGLTADRQRGVVAVLAQPGGLLGRLVDALDAAVDGFAGHALLLHGAGDLAVQAGDGAHLGMNLREYPGGFGGLLFAEVHLLAAGLDGTHRTVDLALQPAEDLLDLRRG